MPLLSTASKKSTPKETAIVFPAQSTDFCCALIYEHVATASGNFFCADSADSAYLLEAFDNLFSRLDHNISYVIYVVMTSALLRGKAACYLGFLAISPLNHHPKFNAILLTMSSTVKVKYKHILDTMPKLKTK